MIKRITIWLAAVLAALAFAPAAGAVTTTLSATADSRVEAAQPGSNYGAYNLKAQLGEIRSYLKFDLSSLPAGTVTQATLRVAPISASSTGLESFAVADVDWTEPEITWSNQPGPIGSSVGQTGGWSDTPAWVSMDVTSIVAGKRGDVSMVVEAVDSSGPTLFKNREWGSTGPKLDVVTTPSGGLSVSPSSLSFAGAEGGDDPLPETLSVSSPGGEPLSYTVSDDAEWLSESPTSGTAPDSVSITASTAGLSHGTYTATVTVTVDGGAVPGSPATIPVTLTVRAGCNRVPSLAAARSELAAGPGSDTAIVDTLDAVSSGCEPVQTLDGGNASEDRPPSVAITAPGFNGTKVGTESATMLTATATDDRGVAKVQFFDDDRLLCEAATAPYTCAYKPRGGDVGRNTLTAVAIDSSQQTASALRTITVGRFAARSVTLKASPKKDTSAPFRFMLSGKVNRPAGVTASQACKGAWVEIERKVRKKTVFSREARLKSDCSFRQKARIASARGRSLKFTARYQGNDVVSGKRSKTVKVKI
jgi:hypothetical protein